MKSLQSIPIIFLAFANDKVDSARYLRNLPLELDGIRKALLPAVKEGLCEVIERANITIEQIFDVFQTYKDRIAIFHYGGHADGYQLLLENISETNKVAHGEGLVSFFTRQKGLELVFFNGCSTQQQSLELVKAGIPAVIGTSNSINDDIASTLSIRFYTGLAKGANIEKAWLEATDEVKMKEGTANLRGLYRKSQTESAPDRFPWEIYFREGAEKVKEWNLPEEVDNPLFGLPLIPPTFQLPESPFLFLKRYERPHAEVFFGRSFYVRELYNKITDKQSPPVILLYGQSGTGKSSLFDAGLNPRLEHSHFVVYLRRDQQKGLVETLKSELEQLYQKQFETTLPSTQQAELPTNYDEQKRKTLLETFKNQLLTLAESEKISFSETIEALEKELLTDNQKQGEAGKVLEIKGIDEQKFAVQFADRPYADILKLWQNIEVQVQKPVVVILDQAEELFTRPTKHLPDELSQLADCLQVIFNNPAFAPQGKIVLGYRKEYQAEFDECFKKYAISRTKVFLEPLSRKDIIDIFKGLTNTSTLRKRYNLQIDNNLAIVIADDLLEDKDSPVAPVLQILLTKMWDKVKDLQNPVFTVDLYQNLKREGFLLDDFFKQQTQKLAEWNKELEDSGLHLDILQFHTTNLGTAGSRSWAEIKQHYGHIPEKAELLLYKLKELYLLIEAGQNRTCLTHDTLAPLVKNEFRKSERTGQRASRILDNQLADFLKNNRQILDELEVDIVEKGREGMRDWNGEEKKFVAESQKIRLEKEKARKRRRQYAIAALSTILITALFSLYQWNKSVKNADSAKMKELMLLSHQEVVNAEQQHEKDIALRLAEQAAQLAEEVEINEKKNVFANFREVSEKYRLGHSEGNAWLPPIQEIWYRKSPYNEKFAQQKMANATFLEMHGRSAEFIEENEEDKSAPIFPASAEMYPEVLLKNTLDHQKLVIWTKKHSFRIYPYKRGKLTKIIRADSTIMDFLPVDSSSWFLLDYQNTLKTFNPQSKAIDSIFTFVKNDSLNDYFQFVRYQNNELYVWLGRKLLRLKSKQSTGWKNIVVDTLISITDENLVQIGLNTDFLKANYLTKLVFNQDMSRGVVYSGNIILLMVKAEQGNAYNLLPIEGLSSSTTGGSFDGDMSFSQELTHLAALNGTSGFSLYKLEIGDKKATLKEVFNKNITSKNNIISRVEISPDNSNHVLIRLGGQVRVYDFGGKIRDIIGYDAAKSMNFYFSENGNYFIDFEQDKIILYQPVYHLPDWLSRTPAQSLSVGEKEKYGIASLRERWQTPASRKMILAQLVSFLAVLLVLIRYSPIVIQIYNSGKHYKLVAYGLAAISCGLVIIYRELFTEIDENIIQKLADRFIILSFFYILVIFFEQRQELFTFAKQQKWLSLMLYSAPEVIVLGLSGYGIHQILQDETSNFANPLWIVPLYILNAFVLWTVHYSEKTFYQEKYIKTFGLLFFSFTYFTFLLDEYVNVNNGFGISVFWSLIYAVLWLLLWIGKGIYNWWVKKISKKEMVVKV